MSYFSIGVRVLLAGVFLTSVFSKVRSPEDFQDFIRSIERMGLWTPARLTAVTAILVEITSVGLMAYPPTQAYGLSCLAGLLAIYAAVLMRQARRPVRVDCRCFGAGSAPISLVHVVRNIFLGAVAAAGLVTAEPIGDIRIAVTAAALGVIGAIVTVRLDDLVALFGPSIPR